MRWKHAAIALGAIATFQAGLLAGGLAPDARAEPGPEEAPRLRCRVFPAAVEGAGSTVSTSDRTTEIGRWLESEAPDHELFSIDFEVAQKPTGYPAGLAWVCVAPRR